MTRSERQAVRGVFYVAALVGALRMLFLASRNGS